jgi:hypothetical protein
LVPPEAAERKERGCVEVGYARDRRRNPGRAIRRNHLFNNAIYLHCLQDINASYFAILEPKRLFEHPLSFYNIANIARWKGAPTSVDEF